MECHLSVQFYIFKEENNYIAYCPSLDLSTSGDSFNNAVSNSYEMLQLYIECCNSNGTLYEDLLAHGWNIDKKDVKPPTFVQLLIKPELKKLVGSDINYERVTTPARIPALI